MRRSPPSAAPTRDALLNLAAQLHQRGDDLQVVARQVATLADLHIGPLELACGSVVPPMPAGGTDGQEEATPLREQRVA